MPHFQQYIDHPDRKYNKEILDLDYTFDPVYLTDIQNIPAATENIFFSNTYGTFSGAACILGHKTSLNKFKTEIIPGIFSKHNDMKWEISNRKEDGNFTNTCGN